MVLVIGLASLLAVRAAAPPGVLGISVKVEDGWLTITAVHDNFPASREGLRPGDRITRIDGQSTRKQSLNECLQRLAGAAGETIILSIARGSPEAQPFGQKGCRLAAIPDTPLWPPAALLALAKHLAVEKILTVIPSDLSEATEQNETANPLELSRLRLLCEHADQFSREMTEIESSLLRRFRQAGDTEAFAQITRL